MAIRVVKFSRQVTKLDTVLDKEIIFFVNRDITHLVTPMVTLAQFLNLIINSRMVLVCLSFRMWVTFRVWHMLVTTYHFTYRVIHNIRPKIMAYWSQNMSLREFQSLLGAHQMWSIWYNMPLKLFGALLRVLEGVPSKNSFFTLMLSGALRSGLKLNVMWFSKSPGNYLSNDPKNIYILLNNAWEKPI